MISIAQKKARENFKKAIEYRKKTGCSLKEAFAHISGKKTVIKKVGTVKKAVKKATKRVYVKILGQTVLVGSALHKTLVNQKKHFDDLMKGEISGVKKKVLHSPLKKKASKKPSEQSILNKIHKVKHDVERLDESQHKHMMSGIDKMDFTRINNDINGNPRYVIHFLDILNMEEREFLPFSKKYIYSLKKAKLIGGKKYDNKQYGGGIVFQSYNIQDLENSINNLRIKTPKIKY